MKTVACGTWKPMVHVECLCRGLAWNRRGCPTPQGFHNQHHLVFKFRKHNLPVSSSASTTTASTRPLTERSIDSHRSQNPKLYLYKFSSRSSILSISSSRSERLSSKQLTSLSMKSRSPVILPPPSWMKSDMRVPTTAHSTRRMSMAKWIQIGTLLMRDFKCLLSWTALAMGNIEATKKMKPRRKSICQFLVDVIRTAVLKWFSELVNDVGVAILKTCFHNRPNAKAPNLSHFRTRRFVLRFNSLLSSAPFRSSLYNSSLNAFAGPRIGTSSMTHASYPQCPCLRLPVFCCKSQVDALQCPLFHMASSASFSSARKASVIGTWFRDSCICERRPGWFSSSLDWQLSPKPKGRSKLQIRFWSARASLSLHVSVSVGFSCMINLLRGADSWQTGASMTLRLAK